MEEKMAKPEQVVVSPPSYYVGQTPSRESKSCKSKALVGYAAAVSIALVVVVVIGSVYYYRSLELVQDAIKTYQKVDYVAKDKPPINQDIEIDTGKQTVVFRLRGEGIAEGSYAVLDYKRSLTGLYDPETKECFLIGGIRKDVVDPKTLSETLENNQTKETMREKFSYRKADDYPIGDKSILPEPLQGPCQYLPTYWLEPDPEGSAQQQNGGTGGQMSSDVSKDRQKRACYYLDHYYIVRVCYSNGACYYYLVRDRYLVC